MINYSFLKEKWLIDFLLVHFYLKMGKQIKFEHNYTVKIWIELCGNIETDISDFN